MKRLVIILILLLVSSCQKPNPAAQLEHISGYWEIESVSMPDGSKKEFSFSYSIDFIEVVADSGVRKKVTPRIDGSFLANDAAEKFRLKIEQDSVRMYYETPFDAWKETVLEAKDSIFRVKNRDHKIYTYKRFNTFKRTKE
jgi:hypothetical protein